MTRHGLTYSARVYVHAERINGEHGSWRLIYDVRYRDPDLKFDLNPFKWIVGRDIQRESV